MSFRHKIEHDRLSEIMRFMGDLNSLNDLDAILSQILLQSRFFCSADAGSIFLVYGEVLKFCYFQNDTFAQRDFGSSRLVYSKVEIPINSHSLVGYSALHGVVLNFENVYDLPPDLPYHFNSEFDKKLDYHTTSLLSVPLINSRHKVIGVLQIVNSLNSEKKAVVFSYEQEKIVSFLASQAAGAIEKAQLTREIILRMIRMAELRDPKETGAHVNRVGAYSVEIYRQWAKEQKIHDSEIKRYIDLLRIAAMLHDVGKVAISDLILKKPAKLEPTEFQIMQTHTQQGANLFGKESSEVDLLAAEIALYHHEKFDGSGYPEGLKGEDIPLSARIVAIADVFDALISRRVYKEAWSELEVLAEIQEQSNRHFDPKLVKVFIKIYDTISAIRSKYMD